MEVKFVALRMFYEVQGYTIQRGSAVRSVYACAVSSYQSKTFSTHRPTQRKARSVYAGEGDLSDFKSIGSPSRCLNPQAWRFHVLARCHKVQLLHSSRTRHLRQSISRSNRPPVSHPSIANVVIILQLTSSIVIVHPSRSLASLSRSVFSLPFETHGL